MAGIPRKDLAGTGLDGAPGDQRVIYGAAGYAVAGGLANARKIVLGIQGHKAQAAMNIVQEFDSLGGSGSMFWR